MPCPFTPPLFFSLRISVRLVFYADVRTIKCTVLTSPAFRAVTAVFWDINAAFNKFVPARNGAVTVNTLNAAVAFTVNTFLFLLQGAPCGGCLQGDFTGVRFTKPKKARRLPYSVFHEISVDITAVRMPAVESVPCGAQ